MSNFDLAAASYDDQFSNTCIGKEQRRQVWKCIEKYIRLETPNVLEINCGTGEDAILWSNKGAKVHATDISEAMINIAKEKHPQIDFEVLDVNHLDHHSGSYDLIFSNFGGLNCLSPTQLKAFFQSTKEKLNPDGTLQIVLMGGKCWWDKLFLILKGRWKERNRRNSSEGIPVNVEGKMVTTWYYSPKEIEQLAMGLFDIESKHPIGLFIPPSFLAKAFERHKIAFSMLKFLDKFLTFSFLSNRADHYFVSLKLK